MSDLSIIIPAAGTSQRFKNEGFHDPKPLLKIKNSVGKTASMLRHVINSLPPNLGRITVGLPIGHRPPIDVIADFKFMLSTMGQADTALQMLSWVPPENKVLVMDCDMILTPVDIQKLLDSFSIADVTIAVTKTFDPNASRVDQLPFPTRFVEKEPISEWGIVGVRGFKNASFLQAALQRTIDRCKTVGAEPYLAMAINHYPGKKFAFEVTEFQDWGTPERIEESGATIVT